MLLMNWKVPREENNRGKRGRPFKSTSTLITFLAKLMSMHSDPSRYTGGIALKVQYRNVMRGMTHAY